MNHVMLMAQGLTDFLGTLLTLAIAIAVLWAVDWLLLRRRRDELTTEERAPRQLGMLALSLAAIIAVSFSLPIGQGSRELLLGILGLVVSAAIALSSTTLIANAMAGLMLRSVRSFRPGDFVRVGDNFGRVTERGLFHTEIQTEDRDLTTLPNLYLVQNPLTVMRSSGTVVSTHLSLGYDVSHATVEPLLLDAAAATALQDPFVRIMQLGDFSVTYRIAGFLTDPRKLISTRSALRKAVLDKLHGAGVEIVSPNFMNQRQISKDEPVLPDPTPASAGRLGAEPEAVIFDKAEVVAKVEDLRAERKKLLARIDELETQIKAGGDEADSRMAHDLENARRRLTWLEDRIQAASKAKDNVDD